MLINEQIREKEVRLIGADGRQLGIMAIGQAQQLADEANLDLVNISPKAEPPVCRIMDYGKYRFEQEKKLKEAKKNQKTTQLKEMRQAMVDHLAERDETFVKDGKLVVRETTMLYSPNYPQTK